MYKIDATFKDSAGELVDPDSVVLSDSTGMWGVKDSVDLVLVAAGTALERTSVGVYTYSFAAESKKFPFTQSLKTVLSGNTVYSLKDIYESSYVGRYTSEQKLLDKFGPDSIERWADLDSSKPDNNKARIATAIYEAEALIDEYLSSGVYPVPFTAPIPQAVTTAATLLAGANLYEARGVEEFDESSSTIRHRLAYHHKSARRMLNKIKNGEIDLGLAHNSTVGEAVLEPVVDSAVVTVEVLKTL